MPFVPYVPFLFKSCHTRIFLISLFLSVFALKIL